MIHGMEILKKTEILEKALTDTGKTTFFICAGIALILLIVAIIVSKHHFDKYAEPSPLSAILVIVAAFIFLFTVLTLPSNVKEIIPTGRYEYEVLISDTSAMKEVYEQYEVVGSKGEIYIIRDREPENDNKFCSEE